MAVQPIPEGYESISPSLAVDNATEAIEFYKKAFGATEKLRMDGPGGTIAHAELEIGNSILMLSDPFPQSDVRPPKEIGGTTVNIFMYVDDVDAAVQQAVDAGATITMPVDNRFWGDRFGTITDPYGHSWGLATHVEDVSPEEMEKRGQEFMAQMAETAGTTT
jgi:PhnB protein